MPRRLSRVVNIPLANLTLIQSIDLANALMSNFLTGNYRPVGQTAFFGLQHDAINSKCDVYLLLRDAMHTNLQIQATVNMLPCTRTSGDF